MHWYKRDPHAAIEGMLGLTMEERGAYNTLIDMLYARDGEVPDDDRFMALAQQCSIRKWRSVLDRLIAKGKVRRTTEGKLTTNGVVKRLKETREFIEKQTKNINSRWNSTKSENSGNTSTSTSKKESLLSYSLTTSEQLQPSRYLLEYERRRRPTPGSLTTAPFDSALASPGFAERVATAPSHKPFTRIEVSKPNGWDFQEARQGA